MAHDPYPDDHTNKLAWVGVAMVALAFIALGFGIRSALTITSLVWGSLIICLALYLRFRGIRQHQSHVEALARLEAERNRQEHQQRVLERITSEGLPAGITLQELRAWVDLAEPLSEESAPER